MIIGKNKTKQCSATYILRFGKEKTQSGKYLINPLSSIHSRWSRYVGKKVKMSTVRKIKRPWAADARLKQDDENRM